MTFKDFRSKVMIVHREGGSLEKISVTYYLDIAVMGVISSLEVYFVFKRKIVCVTTTTISHISRKEAREEDE